MAATAHTSAHAPAPRSAAPVGPVAAPEAARTCVRCVMDTSDPDITFDAAGVCNHCHNFDRTMKTLVLDPNERRIGLEQWVERIRKSGKGRDYDCVVGISGGVDSTYVALKVKELGLRPLAVHLDNGWDTEIAVANIERAVRGLGIDLHTVVLDWEEFRDLQVAFLRAGTPDSEIPTDHAIISSVFHTAWKVGVPYLVMGHNRATELILPPAWSQGHYDWVYLRNVHKRYGTRPLTTYPAFDFVSYSRFRQHTRRHSWNILEYLDYTREGAIDALTKQVGWRNYGGKHHESVYTRFFQNYILPRKFGYDKRRAHLANTVLTGQMTRDAALQELSHPPYPTERAAQLDRTYVVTKLELEDDDFERIMRAPPQRYQDQPNMTNARLFLAARSVYRAAKRLIPTKSYLP